MLCWQARVPQWKARAISGSVTCVNAGLEAIKDASRCTTEFPLDARGLQKLRAMTGEMGDTENTLV